MRGMPRIWNETIAAHRDAVRDATIDATAALVAEHGPTGVTMSRIAEASGIGRATLYKYFPDIESILVAWHERHIDGHLRHLAQAAEAAAPRERLAAVLRAYARHLHAHPDGTELSALLHRGDHVARAQARLRDFLADLLRDAAARGEVRGDVPPRDLALFCLHAATAAAVSPPDRVVTLTLSALQDDRPA